MSAKSNYLTAKANYEAASNALPTGMGADVVDTPEYDAFSAAYVALRAAEDQLVAAVADRMAGRGGAVERALITKARSGMDQPAIREQMVELALTHA